MGGDIILPWPPKEVWSNYRSRTHHARARGIRKAREWALLATKADMPSPLLGDGLIKLVLTFHPRPRGRPDRDNCLSAAKAYLDGIAEAWGVNDRHFDPSVVIADPVPNGKVVVSIKP